MRDKLIENSKEKDDNFLEACDALWKLQQYKGKRYGSSWCKHGEPISIFGNVARKYDRLEQIMKQFVNNGIALPEPTSEESVIETVGDLATYCLLWIGWIKVNRIREYEAWSQRIGYLSRLNQTNGTLLEDLVIRTTSLEVLPELDEETGIVTVRVPLKAISVKISDVELEQANISKKKVIRRKLIEALKSCKEELENLMAELGKDFISKEKI